MNLAQQHELSFGDSRLVRIKDGSIMTQRHYRVLLVNLTNAYGGTDARVLMQARALQGRVAACEVATLSGSDLHRRLQRENLPHHAIDARQGSPLVITKLRRVMKRGDYHVVDAHSIHAILWGMIAASVSGVAGRIVTIHSDFSKEYPGLRGRFYDGVVKLTRPFTKHYINVTAGLQEKCLAAGNVARSTFIPNAVEIPPVLPEHKDTALYREWGFAPEDYVVGMIARLDPIKGHRYLIDALAQLGGLPQVKLLVVGDGPIEADLRAQVEALGLSGRVHFTGFRQDIPRILQSLDALCVASLSEALPYVALEAAAYARPVLSTAVGEMPALLEDGVNGRLVAPGDAAALAGGLRWLVENPADARRIGQNARAMVTRAFNIETMIDAVLDVYDFSLF